MLLTSLSEDLLSWLVLVGPFVSFLLIIDLGGLLCSFSSDLLCSCCDVSVVEFGGVVQLSPYAEEMWWFVEPQLCSWTLSVLDNVRCEWGLLEPSHEVWRGICPPPFSLSHLLHEVTLSHDGWRNKELIKVQEGNILQEVFV